MRGREYIDMVFGIFEFSDILLLLEPLIKDSCMVKGHPLHKSYCPILLVRF